LHGSLTQDLVRFGYERDERWLRELAGVTPDNGLSKDADHPPLGKRFRDWKKHRSFTRKYLRAAPERVHLGGTSGTIAPGSLP
jgi:hypothetical protein